jgi:hypothetical protein
MRIAVAKAHVLRGDGIYIGFNIAFQWRPSQIWRNPLWTFLIDIDLFKINLCLEMHGKYKGRGNHETGNSISRE